MLRCIETREAGFCWSVSGKEKISYLELIREVRRTVGSRTRVIRIPVGLFRLLLQVYAWFDRNPPFTARQLAALVTDELFEDSDWERRFGLHATPLVTALHETFTHPVYSRVELRF